MIKKEILEKLEEDFLTKREALLKSSREEVMTEGGDDLDRIQNKIINEMTDRLSMRDRAAVMKINAALLRIKEGTFGTCEQCDEDIGEKRLLIVPLSNLCVVCMEKLEKQAKQYRSGV